MTAESMMTVVFVQRPLAPLMSINLINCQKEPGEQSIVIKCQA